MLLRPLGKTNSYFGWKLSLTLLIGSIVKKNNLICEFQKRTFNRKENQNILSKWALLVVIVSATRKKNF